MQKELQLNGQLRMATSAVGSRPIMRWLDMLDEVDWNCFNIYEDRTARLETYPANCFEVVFSRSTDLQLFRPFVKRNLAGGACSQLS
jgi:hypothetical protein